jgi:hypothetical protein
MLYLLTGPALLLLQLLIQNVVSNRTPVIVDLQIASAAGSCVGGDVGLTNTSIILEYRIVNNVSALTEWMFLADIPPTEVFIEEFVMTFDDYVHFRLVQLEHGGFGCNCWDIITFSIRGLVSSLHLSPNVCLKQPGNETPTPFCGDFRARVARGMITRPHSAQGIAINCPADSVGLIPSIGPPVPSECDNITPRM